MNWLRLWHDARTDRKLDALSDAEHRVWVNLLIYASEQPTRGAIVGRDEAMVAVEVARGDLNLLHATLAHLELLEIVAWDEDAIRFLHWDKRQPSSDDAAARQRNSRSARDEHENVTPAKREAAPTSRDGHVTPPNNVVLDTDTELETETEPQKDTSWRNQHMATPASPSVGLRPHKASKNGYDPRFEAWWSVYPRHDGKLPASLAYRDRIKAGRDPTELDEAAHHFANHHEAAATPTEKIPHASTWLHQHRDEEWEHGPPDADRVVVPRNGTGPPSKLAQTAATLRQLKALQETNGDERTSFFALATTGLGLPDAGRGGADSRALPRPPEGPAMA